MVFQEGYKGASWVSQEYSKGLSMKNKECFEEDLEEFQGILKDISKNSKGCFKKVSKEFQGMF